MSHSLQTEFLGKVLNSPFVLASGIVDISYSSMVKCAEYGAGAVTTKSLTLEKRKGHSGPVVAEFTGGFMNSMGLSNPGIELGMREIEEVKSRSDVAVILSVFAASTKAFTELIPLTNQSQADFLELNLSCPNVADEFGIPLASSKSSVGEIISEVKKSSTLPVIAKLSPNSFNVADIALAAMEAGADALTLVNTLGPGMAIDIHAKKPIFPGKFGGVSGPAIKPLALKIVYDAFKKSSAPIIGTGGITTGTDAIEFLLAGAKLLGIGTAVYYRGLEVFSALIKEVSEYLLINGNNTINDIKPI